MQKEIKDESAKLEKKNVEFESLPGAVRPVASDVEC